MTYKLFPANLVQLVETAEFFDSTAVGNRHREAFQLWLALGNVPLPADPVVPNPDAQGFFLGLKALFGGVISMNTVAKAYPTLVPDLLAGNWADLQAIILDAQAKAAINPAQYTAIKDLATQYFIPVVLP